jgi:hypothetical protein
MVLTERSTSQDFTSQGQDPDSRFILTDTKLRHELPTASRAGIPLDRYVETSFSVYKSGYVRLQSFLLIGRTWRIITSLCVHARIVHSGCITTFKERVAQDTNGVSSK